MIGYILWLLFGCLPLCNYRHLLYLLFDLQTASHLAKLNRRRRSWIWWLWMTGENNIRRLFKLPSFPLLSPQKTANCCKLSNIWRHFINSKNCMTSRFGTDLIFYPNLSKEDILNSIVLTFILIESWYCNFFFMDGPHLPIFRDDLEIRDSLSHQKFWSFCGSVRRQVK